MSPCFGDSNQYLDVSNLIYETSKFIPTYETNKNEANKPKVNK